jgi:hypothetical protein
MQIHLPRGNINNIVMYVAEAAASRRKSKKTREKQHNG